VSRDFADWGPVNYHLGRVLRSLGDRSESLRWLDAARREAQSGGSHCWELWAAFAVALTLHETGERNDARRSSRMLDRASSEARRLKLSAIERTVASFRQRVSGTKRRTKP